MGLDTVELIMAVEEEFDISIPDKVARGIETAGDLCEVVVKIRSENPSASAPENTAENVWEKGEAIIVDELGVDPGKVTRKERYIKDLGAD